MYYLYLTENGQRMISPIKYYERPDLQGKYHPYNTWRYVGRVLNDGSSNFTEIYSDAAKLPVQKSQTITSTSNFIVPWNVFSVTNEIWGGGAGGISATITTAGSGGGYSKKKCPVVPLQSIPVSIGNGGGSAASGGTTSFGSYNSATGGTAGAAGNPGVGSGGDINLSGGIGSTGGSFNLSGGGSATIVGIGGIAPLSGGNQPASASLAPGCGAASASGAPGQARLFWEEW